MCRKMCFFVIAGFLFLQSTSMISAQNQAANQNKNFSVINLPINQSDLDITGQWDIKASMEGQEVPATLTFKQDGENFTGTISSEHGGGEFKNGKVTENDLTGTINFDVQGQSIILNFTAKVDGDKISGTLTSDMIGSLPFTGKKAE